MCLKGWCQMQRRITFGMLEGEQMTTGERYGEGCENTDDVSECSERFKYGYG